MDIDVPLRGLGAVDTTALREAILGQEEVAWHEDEYRQQTYHHHDQTRSIVMVFTDASNWPAANVQKQPGWERIAHVAVPVMQDGLEEPARVFLRHDQVPCFLCPARGSTVESRSRMTSIAGRQLGSAWKCNLSRSGAEMRIGRGKDGAAGDRQRVNGKGRG